MFGKKQVNLYNKNTCECVIQGVHNPKTALYIIIMYLPAVPMAPNVSDKKVTNHVYETKSNQYLILFYHGVCFSPPKITFIKAIKQNAFTSW